MPPVLQNRSFAVFLVGLAFAQIGARATVAANLWQVFELTGDTARVGFVGLSEAVALLIIGPLGGAVADRMDRRRLLQAAQTVSLMAASFLAVVTLSQMAEPWHVYLAVLVVSAATTFEGAARQALIPALVPKEQLLEAFALANPTREVAVLIGPSLAGILIATSGTGSVYLLNVATALTLIISLTLLRPTPVALAPVRAAVWKSILDGFAYVKGRPLVWQLMALDFSATFFCAYRVLLPELTQNVLQVGPEWYGVLIATPAVGAIAGASAVYRIRKVRRKGLVILGATMAYGACAVVLGRAGLLPVALVAIAGLGFFDAAALTFRHAAVQMETPDELRGRVTALYQMVSRGGPSLGQSYMGVLAGALGASIALPASAVVTVAYAGWLAFTGKTVKQYV